MLNNAILIALGCGVLALRIIEQRLGIKDDQATGRHFARRRDIRLGGFELSGIDGDEGFVDMGGGAVGL